MEFITSRSFKLPTEHEEMENQMRFNMWTNKLFPYKELLPGDILFWFDTISQKLAWKTQVIMVDRFQYLAKQEICDRYPIIINDDYYKKGPDRGYFLGYKVKVQEKIEIIKPPQYSFPRIGWIRINNIVSMRWFQENEAEDANTLDNIISLPNKSIVELLTEINNKMQNISPERITKLVSTTIRKDSPIIKALKKSTDYKCQYPKCDKRILKKNGEYYIEVAHIEPVKNGGKSVIGNLLVLCPNHHKEFDYGNLVVKEQTTTKITGQLNAKDFFIEITNLNALESFK